MAELTKDTSYAGVASPTDLRAPVSDGDAVNLKFANTHFAGLPIAAATPNAGDVPSWDGSSVVWRPLVASVEPLPVGVTAETGVSPFFAPIDHVHVGSTGTGTSDAQHTPMGTATYPAGAVPITANTSTGLVISELNQALAYMLPAAPPTLDEITPTSPVYHTAALSSGSTNYGALAAGDTYTKVMFAASNPISYAGFGPGDTGVLAYSTYSFNLKTAFDETYRTTAQGASYDGGQGIPETSSVFTINSIQRHPEYAGYQLANVTLNYTNTIGFNDFQFTHTVDSAVATSQSTQAWYDNGVVPTAPIARVRVVTPTLNYTSGIPHLGSGSVISFTTGGISGVFNNTYNVDGSFARITGPAIDPMTLTTSSSNITGVTTPIPAISDSPVLSAVKATLANPIAVTDANWALTVLSPRGDSAAVATINNTAGSKFNLNTYGLRSTDLTEFFTDEHYRLSSGGAAPNPSVYDSVVTLTDLQTAHASVDWTAPVAASELVLLGGSLTYGNMDLSTYTPAGPNYSNRSGWQGYTRYWQKAACSNLTINLPAALLSAPGFTLQIKLPGVTGWLNVLSAYMGGTPSSDGDGCLMGTYTVTNGVASIPVTFGFNSTVMANNLIITRMGATGSFTATTSMSLS